jgi:hypothetical protein
MQTTFILFTVLILSQAKIQINGFLFNLFKSSSNIIITNL